MTEKRIFFCRCGAPISRLGVHVLRLKGRDDEDFCSREHLDEACKTQRRLYEQTKQKCDELELPLDAAYYLPQPIPRLEAT